MLQENFSQEFQTYFTSLLACIFGEFPEFHLQNRQLYLMRLLRPENLLSSPFYILIVFHIVNRHYGFSAYYCFSLLL